MKVYQRVLGMVSTNVYLLVNEDTKESVIIDPADNINAISELIEKSESKPVAVLLTHGHFDHIGAVDKVREKYNTPVYASCYEENVLREPGINLSAGYGMNLSVYADYYFKDEEEINVAGFNIKTISTPGHTEGGACYYFMKEGILFSGDSLFCCSIGRTDFPTSSTGALIKSIEKKLFVLPEDTIVYPGHGEATTIGYEKQNNPFFG